MPRANFEKGVKVCGHCGVEKSIKEFSKSKSKVDGLCGWCRGCCYDYNHGNFIPKRKKLIAKPGYKICYKCGNEKLLKCFSKCKNNKDGLRGICKVCAGLDGRIYRIRKGICKKRYRSPKYDFAPKEGYKFCSMCGIEKLRKEFNMCNSEKDGLSDRCKECEKNIHKKRKGTKKYKEQVREQRLKREYKITIEDYNEMLESQNGGCAICGTKNPGKRRVYFSVDHDHKTGKIRGLLCHNCNFGLGCFRDNHTLLVGAVRYLERC